MAYCVEADLNNMYGANNVQTWADLDGDEDAGKIAARIAAAIVVADDEIDSYMRGGPYPLPLADDASATPKLVTDISAKLAGVWLYESRGVQDISPEGDPVHRLQWQRKRAYQVMRELKAGVLRLDDSDVESFAPAVVTDD
jgi:phage gp36-like protein